MHGEDSLARAIEGDNNTAIVMGDGSEANAGWVDGNDNNVATVRGDGSEANAMASDGCTASAIGDGVLDECP